jgi:poly-gamma-glutamate capsule biosynthesis protein CapA/YwtB (metallophosphatase superfamily)
MGLRGWLLAILTIVVGGCQIPPNPLLEGVSEPSQVHSTEVINSQEPDPTEAQKTPTLFPTNTHAYTPTTKITPIPLTPTQTPLPITTLLFTGVIVPARCVQAAIDAAEDSDYLYDEVRTIISQADLAIGTLNATISDYPPHTGCVPTYLLVGSSENADAMNRAGFDVMSVATNHIKNCGISNCGDRAFFDTLENLMSAEIMPVGAGENHEQAMQPVVLDVNGVRFGFVSLGQLEPLAFATQDEPGIAVLNEDNLRSAIRSAQLVSDVVIVMPHWGPEDVPTPNWSQRELGRIAVEAGAGLVVGNHTHVIQAIEEIDRVPVFYGLGNFVFDQNWARDHQQGVILLVHFQGTEIVDYDLIPTHVDMDGRVHLAEPEEAAEILARIDKVSRALP